MSPNGGYVRDSKWPTQCHDCKKPIEKGEVIKVFAKRAFCRWCDEDAMFDWEGQKEYDRVGPTLGGFHASA